MRQPDVAAAAAATVEDLRRAYYDSAAAGQGNWISEVQLDPPQLIVCDEGSGQTYRVPVAIAGEGAFTFGTAVPVQVHYVDAPGGTSAAASFRRATATDERRISAAIARGAIRPERAGHWRTLAARGEDISVIDRLAGVAPMSPLLARAARGQALDEDEAVYEAFFSPLKPPAEDGALEPYRQLFPPGSHAEVVARGAAADRAEVQAARKLQPLTDNELYEAVWPEDVR